jgi:predicted glycosyltransferase
VIVVYAMGGGLGHLARTRRVLAALEPGGAQAAVITASPLAGAMHLGANTETIVAPRDRAAFPRWLKATLRSLAPDTVVVDAFPLGIFGELADRSVLPEARLFHVARLLRWNAYRGAFAGTPRRYDATFAVEALTPAHAAFIEQNSARVLSLSLAALEVPPLQAGAPWLISHAGPQAEVDALHAFARREAARRGERPRFAFRTPRSPGAEAFGALVTACGFNSMLEGQAYGERHFFLPLERTFDDQALRAARRRREMRA